MIYYLISIVLLTIVFVLLRRIIVIKFCAICGAVLITWFIGLVGIYMNLPWADPLLILILMGASLGALAEKYGTKYGLIWKSLMILIGFPGVYYLVQERFWIGGGLMLVLVFLTIIFSRSNISSNTEHKDIFKECC